MIGKKHQAICSFNKALAVDENSVGANLNLGNLLYNALKFISLNKFLIRKLVLGEQIVYPSNPSFWKGTWVRAD